MTEQFIRKVWRSTLLAFLKNCYVVGGTVEYTEINIDMRGRFYYRDKRGRWINLDKEEARRLEVCK